MKMSREGSVQTMDRDEFHDIGEILIGSPRVSFAARNLGFDQPSEGEDRKPLDLRARGGINGIGKVNFTSLSSAIGCKQELNRDAARTAELRSFRVPGESSVLKRFADSFRIALRHQ